MIWDQAFNRPAIRHQSYTTAPLICTWYTPSSNYDKNMFTTANIVAKTNSHNFFFFNKNSAQRNSIFDQFRTCKQYNYDDDALRCVVDASHTGPMICLRSVCSNCRIDLDEANHFFILISFFCHYWRSTISGGYFNGRVRLHTNQQHVDNILHVVGKVEHDDIFLTE